MLDELRSMAVFATVVREGTFRAAAKQLQLSTSVVSHHLTQLERRLGCALLYRTTRKLSLTPDGEHFFEACSRAIDAAQEGLQRIQTQQKTLAGRLRIGAPAILAQGPFVRDVHAFATAHPAVDLELLFTDERQNQVAESIDVVVRIGWLEDSTLRARKLFEVRRVVCAAPALLALYPPVQGPSDLSALPWIASTALPGFLDLSSAAGDVQRVQCNSRITVNSGLAARELALAGAGALVTLDFFVQAYLERGELVPLLNQWEPTRPSFYAVWPNNVARSALAQRFVEHLVKRTSPNPGTETE